MFCLNAAFSHSVIQDFTVKKKQIIKTSPHPDVTTASSWSPPVWGWGTARNTGWRWQTAAGWSPHSEKKTKKKNHTERQGGKVAWAGKCSANIQEFTLRKEMGALTVTILSYTNIPDTIISSVKGFNSCSLPSHSVSTFYSSSNKSDIYGYLTPFDRRSDEHQAHLLRPLFPQRLL